MSVCESLVFSSKCASKRISLCVIPFHLFILHIIILTYHFISVPGLPHLIYYKSQFYVLKSKNIKSTKYDSPKLVLQSILLESKTYNTICNTNYPCILLILNEIFRKLFACNLKRQQMLHLPYKFNEYQILCT